jgi:hypothetical protein
MTVKWNGEELERRIRAGAMRGVMRTVLAVEERATDLILNTPKTGRVYRRRGTEHQASAPGEPPASDTGRLVQSSAHSFDERNLSGTVNWSAAHAAPLELGTDKMEPRPFARPALDLESPSLAENVAAGIRETLR